jgi:predicted O-linked N-acetylglucosamine transferase (SPINDLY family)
MQPLNRQSIPQAIEQARNHLRAKQFREAELLFRQVLGLDPSNHPALYHLGLLALRGGHLTDATLLLGKAAAANPADADSWIDLGNALMHGGKLEEATDAYRKTIALRPDNGAGYSNLGIALYRLRRFDEAIPLLHKAAELSPDQPEIFNNVGNALIYQNRPTEAIAAFQRALALRPNDSDAHTNLSNILVRSGRVDEALAHARRAIEIDPSILLARNNLLLCLPLDPNATPQEIFEAHQLTETKHASQLAHLIRPAGNDRSPERRLRVGYVSPDFRDHSVATFFYELLAAHSPDAVETFCYAHVFKRDELTAQFEKMANHWRDIANKGDDALAEMVRNDKIDILVDLAGHTVGNRLMLFARKPAPVQISYLGYPNTTGMGAMDYLLTDPHCDPPGVTDRYYSEKLIRLPKTFAVYHPHDVAPAVNELPATKNGFVTFVSFNRLEKLNPPLCRAWSEILARTPRAQLVIVANALNEPAIAHRTARWLEHEGVATDRVLLRGKVSTKDYFTMHHHADVLLDTFPVNGHTVTCHAAWMGVPTIVLEGSMHVGRMGFSVNTNLGLPQCIGGSTEQYIERAVALATDLPALAEIRRTLRDRMKSSPIMDYPRFARDVENAYRTIWTKWCAQ